MEKKAASSPHKIPVLDIPGLGAFQFMNGNEPDMVLNGTRATLLFNADDKFFELAERFSKNEPVKILDLLNAQRQLKSRMYSLKGQRNG